MWNQHHSQFSDDLHRFFTGLGASLKRLHEIQFDAPWRRNHHRDTGQA